MRGFIWIGTHNSLRSYCWGGFRFGRWFSVGLLWLVTSGATLVFSTGVARDISSWKLSDIKGTVFLAGWALNLWPVEFPFKFMVDQISGCLFKVCLRSKSACLAAFALFAQSSLIFQLFTRMVRNKFLSYHVGSLILQYACQCIAVFL